MAIDSDGNADPAGRNADGPGPERGAAQVSQDMQGIFGAAEPLPSEDGAHGPAPIGPIVARSMPSRAGRTGALAGVVIAGALAVSIGLTQQGTSNLSPSPIAPSSSGEAEVHRVFASAEPRAMSVPSKIMAGEDVAEASRLTLGNDDAARRLVRRPVARGGTSCDRLDRVHRAWCMRPQVVAADRQLRRAYRGAARAGVDRRVLVSYRDQWSRLRGRANSDPRRVAQGFRQMAQQLDAARRDRRARDS